MSETAKQPENLSHSNEVVSRQQALRAALTVRPVTPDERRLHEDICWALDDPEVWSEYRDEYVVPYNRRIVAHGHDPRTVHDEAARVTGRPFADLPLVPIVDPLLDIPPDDLGIFPENPAD
jgi:hypothetical protein